MESKFLNPRKFGGSSFAASLGVNFHCDSLSWIPAAESCSKQIDGHAIPKGMIKAVRQVVNAQTASTH